MLNSLYVLLIWMIFLSSSSSLVLSSVASDSNNNNNNNVIVKDVKISKSFNSSSSSSSSTSTTSSRSSNTSKKKHPNNPIDYPLSSAASSSSASSSSLIPKQPNYHQNRPFYNIAHMVNSINEISTFLDRGSNAIETDIYFAANATPILTFHGYPCDCFRHCGEYEQVEKFLQHIRSITTPNNPVFDKRLLLILFDLKLMKISHSARALAGQKFASLLLNNLYSNITRHQSSSRSTSSSTISTTRRRNQINQRNNNNDDHNNHSRVRLIISIGHVFDYDFILGFQNELESKGFDWLSNKFIGWDVGMNDPIFAIESMWKRLDMIENIWQGDGRSNCLSPFYNLGRLTQIVKKRDNPSYFAVKNYIKKVYQWTVDLTVNIRTALRSNIDAIITNHPERVWSVLNENEFSKKYRIAGYDDSPWERILTRPMKPQTSSMLNKPTLGLKLVNGAGDMLESFTKFLSDTIKYQTPLRYLFYKLSTATKSSRRSSSLSSSLTSMESLFHHNQRTRTRRRKRIQSDEQQFYRTIDSNSNNPPPPQQYNEELNEDNDENGQPNQQQQQDNLIGTNHRHDMVTTLKRQSEQKQKQRPEPEQSEEQNLDPSTLMSMIFRKLISTFINLVVFGQ